MFAELSTVPDTEEAHAQWSFIPLSLGINLCPVRK